MRKGPNACRFRQIHILPETDPMTRIGRPYWITGRLLLLALAAFFVATAISSVVRGRLDRAGMEGGTSVSAPMRETTTDPLSAYLPIARRGLFAEARDDDPRPRRSAATTTASGDLTLLGTGGAGPERFGILEDKKEKEQRLVRLGDDLAGGEVVEIGWRRLVVRRGAREEVFLVPPDVGLDGGSKPARTTSRKRPSSETADSSRVKTLGDDRFLISRDEVDHQLENLSTLFTQMRAVPSMKDGATQGFRVFAIRRDSLFQELGLRNNDVVQRINGVELTDPTRAMGLFEELKNETRLSVDVLRGGKPRTLSYEIR